MRAVGEHREHDVRAFRRCGHIGAGNAARLFKTLQRLRGNVVTLYAEALFYEIRRHGPAHCAQADETDFHSRSPQ